MTFATAFGHHLVAGFQPRFVPPSPFFATLTACSSSNPVTYFSHSHPGGLVSLLPARLPVGPDPRALSFRHGGRNRWGKRFPAGPGHRSAEAFRCVRVTASAAEATDPVPAPPGVRLALRRPPADLRLRSSGDLTVPGCPVPVRRHGKP
jgi:hypothetical protein